MKNENEIKDVKKLIEESESNLKLAKEKLAKLEAEPKEKRGNFMPKDREKYYVPIGNSIYWASTCVDDGVDKRNYNLGICCRTKEEAILLAKKNHALRVMQDAIDEMEGERDEVIYLDLSRKIIYRNSVFKASSDKVFLTTSTDKFDLRDFIEQGKEIGNYYRYINFLD